MKQVIECDSRASEQSPYFQGTSAAHVLPSPDTSWQCAVPLWGLRGTGWNMLGLNFGFWIWNLANAQEILSGRWVWNGRQAGG